MDDLTGILQNENTEGKRECRQNKKKKKLIFFAGIVLLIMIMTIVFLKCIIIPQNKYNQALSLIEEKEYLKSYTLFKSLGDYKDSESIIKNFRFLPKQVKEYNSEREINTMDYIYSADNNYLKVINSYYGPTVIQYTFDDNGNCIEVKEGDYIRRYWYDNNGNCTRILYPNSETIYKYDEKGNKVEETSVHDTFTHTREYIYDSNNNCIRELEHWSTHYGVSITEYTYNKEGKCIKEEEIDSEGNRELIEEYSYDERGNCIQAYDPNVNRIFSMEGPSRVTKNIYDENGNCIKETHTFSYDNGSVSENTTEYVYDENGNCIEEIWGAWKDEYTYDENGNCIKKIHKSEYGTDYTEYKDYFIIYARQDLDSFKETDI